MNHESWSSGQYNDIDEQKKQTTKQANRKCSVDLTTLARAGEMPTLRSRGTKTGHVVQNLRTLLVAFGVMWYPRDAPM